MSTSVASGDALITAATATPGTKRRTGRDRGRRALLVAKAQRRRHRRRLQALEDEQDKLLELHYKGGVAESVMRRQTQRIETEERTLNQLLSRSEIQLAEIREALDEALKLTETPLETYLEASDLGKRLLNQAFFSEIRVGAEGEVKGSDHREGIRPDHRPAPSPLSFPREPRSAKPTPETAKLRPLFFGTGV
jgi:hypothetical protein